MNTLSEGVFLVDAEGNVGLGNRLLFQLLGNVDAPQGATLPTQIFDGSYQTPAPVNEALRLGLPASADVTMPGPGDSSRILSVTASPLNSTEGTQVVGVIRDVTEDRRRTQELANFAGVVAHDLRNPLTAVRGWLEVLEDLVEDPATVDIVARIAASESRMNVLIEDLLSYSVVRGGELSPETINLEELFCDIVAAFRDRIIDGRAPTIESDIDAWVRVDRIAMRQVVSNLLGNAMKYAVPGHPPQVTLRLGPVVDGMQHVIVADRGIGLPPGQENKIFQEFHRVAEHRDQCAGTGLGLAICRRVVERHGGRIVATNRPGGGLDIDLAVPATEPTPADAVSFAAWRQARNVRRAAVSLGENPAPTERPART